jgi:Epoxide hydrolase N terminus
VRSSDLRRRIAATRWPEKETVADQSQGVRLAMMQELARYWDLLAVNRSDGGHAMTRHTYDKGITALLVIDPYNDFISEGGKLWDHIRAVAEANDCVPHMLQVLDAAREAKLRVFYAMHLSRIPASKRPFALRLSLVTI